MAQPSDLEARVAALEARVGELAGEAQAAREDAAAARHLAAANDRDVAEVRSEIRDFRQSAVASFNAMRSDLTDLQTEMRTGFTEVRGQLDGAAAGLEQITGLLSTLIAQQGDQPGETS
jgi:chromosome segregation ATPase